MPEKTIILNKTVYSEMTTRELILELFKKNTEEVYINQEHIANAIGENFSVYRKQAAVSKALKKIYNNIIHYQGIDYHIIKVEEGYKLYRKGDIMDELTQNFSDKKVFEVYDTYEVNHNVIAYTIKPQCHNYVTDYMIKAFDEGSFFDIISHGNKLYFLLNVKKKMYNQVLELPQIVKEIERKNQKKTLTATRVIEKSKDHRLS